MIVHSDDMVPPAASELWPHMVPTHGVSVIAGLDSEGYEQLHIVCSTKTPPWILLGMIEAASIQLAEWIAHGEDEE